MLLICTRIVLGPLSRASRSRLPSGAGERHVAHLQRRAPADPRRRELVVAPERAVHEDAVAGLEPAHHGVVEALDHGYVHRPAAGRGVAQRERHGVLPGGRGVAHEARRVAADRERHDLERRGRPAGAEREAAAGLERVPAHAAVAVEDPQEGVVGRQRAPDRLGAPELQRLGALAQDQQAGGVVDLGVGQHHAGDRARADAVRGRLAQQLELLADVRRGVDEEPRPVARPHGERGLGARDGRGAPLAHGPAGRAGAVPLRESSARGRPQDADDHRPYR